jgi:hypothetical protein
MRFYKKLDKKGRTRLDLERTREVVLLEPSWNLAQEDQVIGRAIRINSHASLPLNQQFVDKSAIMEKKKKNSDAL